MGQVLTCCQRGSIIIDDSLASDSLDDSSREVVQRAHVSTPQQQYVYVVRHGEREDDVNDKWTELSDRPYDPPLTATGRLQAQSRATYLAGLPEEERPVVVVTSPFARCIQTAAILFSELSNKGKVPGKLLVHHALGEVHEARVLRCNVKPDFVDSALERQVLAVLEANDCETGLMTVAVLGNHTAFPETRSQALARYDHALTAVLPSRHNTVLVTHGEALGRAVTSLLPHAEVYQAEYCGCVTLHSARHNTWKLKSSSGEEGCSWTD